MQKAEPSSPAAKPSRRRVGTSALSSHVPPGPNLLPPDAHEPRARRSARGGCHYCPKKQLSPMSVTTWGIRFFDSFHSLRLTIVEACSQ